MLWASDWNRILDSPVSQSWIVDFVHYCHYIARSFVTLESYGMAGGFPQAQAIN